MRTSTRRSKKTETVVVGSAGRLVGGLLGKTRGQGAERIETELCAAASDDDDCSNIAVMVVLSVSVSEIISQE